VIFLDTGFLFALVYADDVHHARVREVLERYRDRPLADFVVTTNHVVAETVTLLRKRAGQDPRARHDLAVHVGRQLFAEVFGQVHHATVDDEQAALAYLARHHDKDYSFVDCLSFVVMDRLGIREALAVDADFTHRFVALPGPLPK
jgi:predicted nucleic acid-binding protein